MFVFCVITANIKYPAAGRLLSPAATAAACLLLTAATAAALLPNKRGEHYGVRHLKWNDNDTRIPHKLLHILVKMLRCNEWIKTDTRILHHVNAGTTVCIADLRNGEFKIRVAELSTRENSVTTRFEGCYDNDKADYKKVATGYGWLPPTRGAS
jgi:hypothetical protein